MFFQPTLQDRDRRDEVVTGKHHQVDVVDVLAATEAVRQVVPRIHRRTTRQSRRGRRNDRRYAIQSFNRYAA